MRTAEANSPPPSQGNVALPRLLVAVLLAGCDASDLLVGRVLDIDIAVQEWKPDGTGVALERAGDDIDGRHSYAEFLEVSHDAGVGIDRIWLERVSVRPAAAAPHVTVAMVTDQGEAVEVSTAAQGGATEQPLTPAATDNLLDLSVGFASPAVSFRVHFDGGEGAPLPVRVEFDIRSHAR